MKSGIYQIVNLSNGKFYIGSSKDLRRRKSLHFSDLRKNKHVNLHLQNSFNKYGEDSFSFVILLECPPEDLLSKEQLLIDTLHPVYNFCKIAGSRLGCKHSEETKRLISEIQVGRKLSKEHIENIAKGNRGKVRTSEMREKYSKAKKGTQMTEETKQMLRKINQKPVHQYTLEGEFIQEWPCARMAAESLGHSGRSCSISHVCSGRNVAAYGFIWKYKTDADNESK